jgi:hypothetical protein
VDRSQIEYVAERRTTIEICLGVAAADYRQPNRGRRQETVVATIEQDHRRGRSAHAENGHVGHAVDLVENIRTRLLQEKFPDEERELFELGASSLRAAAALLLR